MENDEKKERAVEVVLPEETITEIDLNSESPKATQTAAEVKEVEKVAKVDNRESKPAVDEREKALQDLRKQYEHQKRVAEAERDARKQAEMYAREQAQQVHYAKNEVQDGNLKIILNAIDATEQSAASAERDYATAMAAGDYAMAAKAQRLMAQAESHLLQLQNGRQRLEEMLSQPIEGAVREQEIPTFEPQIQPDPLEMYASKLSPKSASWLRNHPEVVHENKVGKLTRAHQDAVEDGLVAESPEYFKYIESRLGYNSYADDPEPEQASAPVRNQQSLKKPAVSAPVTSSSSSATPRAASNSNSMVLSSDEVEVAILTEPDLPRDKAIEMYARNKAYLIKEGKLRA